jgi:hypothetical protein
LKSYLEADQNLVGLYGEPRAWASKGILNVASSGKFSSDRTISQYAAANLESATLPGVMNNPGHQLALPPFTGRRTSGVLMHVTSLPSPYGIGDVGPAAFAGWTRLHDAGQSLVCRLLPLGPTG